MSKIRRLVPRNIVHRVAVLHEHEIPSNVNEYPTSSSRKRGISLRYHEKHDVAQKSKLSSIGRVRISMRKRKSEMRKRKRKRSLKCIVSQSSKVTEDKDPCSDSFTN
jgi:hypothetical protein